MSLHGRPLTTPTVDQKCGRIVASPVIRACCACRCAGLGLRGIDVRINWPSGQNGTPVRPLSDKQRRTKGVTATIPLSDVMNNLDNQPGDLSDLRSLSHQLQMAKPSCRIPRRWGILPSTVSARYGNFVAKPLDRSARGSIVILLIHLIFIHDLISLTQDDHETTEEGFQLTSSFE